jgi:ketosteroid isomerase-like protein
MDEIMDAELAGTLVPHQLRLGRARMALRDTSTDPVTREENPMRTIPLVLACCLWVGTARAQDPAAEVKQAMEALRQAAEKRDAALWSRYATDDLRFVGGDGVVWTKKQRLDALVKGAPAPTRFENIDVKVHGDTALVVADSVFASGNRNRIVRTFMKLDGRWQLVLHAGIAVK